MKPIRLKSKRTKYEQMAASSKRDAEFKKLVMRLGKPKEKK